MPYQPGPPIPQVSGTGRLLEPRLFESVAQPWLRSFSPCRYPLTMAFERIVVDQKVMAGVPCIRGTRIPVTTLVGMVAEGMTPSEIKDDFPQLSDDDIKQALLFAAAAVDQATIPLPATA